MATKSKQQNHNVVTEPEVLFRDCKLFDETAEEKFRAYPGLAEKFQEFIEYKTANRIANFGGSDKSFKFKNFQY